MIRRLTTIVLLVSLVLAGSFTAWAQGDARSPITAANADSLAPVLAGDASGVNALVWSPDGTVLAVAGTPEIWLYDVQDLEAAPQRLRGHGSAVRSLAFNPDGTLLASASWDATVRLWDTATGGELLVLEPPVIEPVAPEQPAGEEADAGEAEAETAGDESAGEEAEPADDQDEGGEDEAAIEQAGAEPCAQEGHTEPVWAVAFSPDGTMLATGGLDQTANGGCPARLWNVSGSGDELTVELKYALQGHTRGVYYTAFSADGAMLITASSDGTVRLWDTESGAELATLDGHGSSVWSMALSPDGSTLATGGWDNSARLWSLGDDLGASLAVFGPGDPDAGVVGHTDWVDGLAFAPDGTLLATVSEDGTARLWDIAEGDQRDALVLYEPGLDTLDYQMVAVQGIMFAPPPVETEPGEALTGEVPASVEPDEFLAARDVVLETVDEIDGIDLGYVTHAQIDGTELIVYGVDTAASAFRLPFDQGAAWTDDPSGIVLTSALAETLGKSLGDTVDITPAEDGQATPIEIIGIVPSRLDGAYMAWEELAAIDTAISNEGAPLVNTMYIRLDADHQTPERATPLAEYIRFTLQDEGVHVALRFQYRRVDLQSTAFSSDGSLWVVGGSVYEQADEGTRLLPSETGALWLWDMEQGAVIGSVDDFAAGVSLVAFSPDGTLLATWTDNLSGIDVEAGASSADNTPGTLQLWAVAE
ncbi:MAG: WD40 repeat domain-containing protein [Chloroflexi bacterium]|nr:WD40 repeat domain-containing protein [Chloroflexota bacterium]